MSETKTYKTMKMYDIIKEEMKAVLEAEENSKAWKDEARTRMKDVNALITAAKKVNKDTEIVAADLVAEIRAELSTEAEEAAAFEDEAEAPEEADTEN